MEYHDKMNRLRKRRMASTIIFLPSLLVWISAIIIKRDALQMFLVLVFILQSVAGCLIFGLLFFEYHRPDFVITDKSITFSNLGPAYLLRKKDYMYIVPFVNIVEITDLDDRMGFEINGEIKHVVIIKDQFDNYSKIRTNIIELAKRYNVKILA